MTIPLNNGIKSDGSWSSIYPSDFMNTNVPFDDGLSFPFSWMYHPFSRLYSILQWSADTALSLISTSLLLDLPTEKELYLLLDSIMISF